MVRIKGFMGVTTIAVAAALGACSSPPSIQTGEDADTIMDGRLARVDNSRSSLAYVDPNGDYGRFSKVLVAPLDLDNVEIVQPNNNTSVINRFNTEWELTDEDTAKLQDQFQEAMAKAFGNNSFALTEEGGKDVVRVDAMITRIAPSAPRDDVTTRGTRSIVLTEGAGSMSISMVLSDGYSGEVLAIIKDAQTSGSTNIWSINNSVTNMAEVRRIFNIWGNRLADGLVALQAREADAAP